ncbi:UspA domain-containing protein [Syntrophobotulus glycolicus DSM 8271]|uniref:Universal stress protein n=1 Tax=Syntrophobotulus glycolicus (strain DSM 8271 / FlGlyR) TaxID=645991 RepID=F0T1L0_SYNGF|nr:universal stress protein [Syntrophobotulus glycolicus]ADY57434.1 UspA domain-containing protein [Syntrophobotulus glycolicus DSM 8271]
MFKKILVPTDISDFSKRALSTALEVADRFKAEVELLHVVPLATDFLLSEASYGVAVDQNELNKSGEAVLEASIEGFKINGLFKKKVIAGHPVTEILKEVEEENIDLLVMGHHGYGAISGSLMGSVSQRVLHKAKCPVMIVK